MQLGCCVVLHIQNVVLCPLFAFKASIQYALSVSLKSAVFEDTCGTRMLCAKNSRFCWFGTSGQKENFLTLFLGVAIRTEKELCDTHAAKTFSRAIKCVLYVCLL